MVFPTTKQQNNHPARQPGNLRCLADFVDVLTRLWLTRHVQKSITDKADATDLFFHGFLLCLAGFVCACRALGFSRIISCWRLDRLHCSKLLLKTKPLNNQKPTPIFLYFYLLIFFHPFNPYNPCSFHLRVFFRTRIFRIDADASLFEVLSSRQQSL